MAGLPKCLGPGDTFRAREDGALACAKQRWLTRGRRVLQHNPLTSSQGLDACALLGVTRGWGQRPDHLARRPIGAGGAAAHNIKAPQAAAHAQYRSPAMRNGPPEPHRGKAPDPATRPDEPGAHDAERAGTPPSGPHQAPEPGFRVGGDRSPSRDGAARRPRRSQIQGTRPSCPRAGKAAAVKR